MLGIKLANTEETYKRCIEYLESKGVKCLYGTVLFYISTTPTPPKQGGDEKKSKSIPPPNPLWRQVATQYEGENIKAVAGWHGDLGGAVDPLVSDGAAYTETLGIFMYGYLAGKGYEHMSCWTENEEWKKILIKLGFTELNERASRLVTALPGFGK
jgi:hypothetical protein